MVKRLLLVMLLYSSTMGMSCGGSSLVCSNQLDGSEFGFTITIPDEFSCVNTWLRNPFSLAQVRYALVDTEYFLSVQVNPSASDQDVQGVTVEDLEDYLNSRNTAFEIKKVVFAMPGSNSYVYSYVAGVPLANGKNLLVSLGGSTDNVDLLATLKTVLDNVELVASE